MLEMEFKNFEKFIIIKFQKLEEENLEMFKLLKEIISDKNILWKFRKPYYHKLLKILEDKKNLNEYYRNLKKNKDGNLNE